jgi:hypothetical protein
MIGMRSLQLGGWVVSECSCRLYSVLRLDFRRSTRLQMKYDAWYFIQASRRHGGMGLYAEHTVSRAFAHYNLTVLQLELQYTKIIMICSSFTSLHVGIRDV